jgi:ATP-dependent RNA helicase DHX8/PRP22
MMPTSHVQVHMEEGPGDILVFLTGQDEIDSAARLLEEKAAQIADAAADGAHSLVVQPIYAALPPEQQMKVSGGPGPCRKLPQ